MAVGMENNVSRGQEKKNKLQTRRREERNTRKKDNIKDLTDTLLRFRHRFPHTPEGGVLQFDRRPA